MTRVRLVANARVLPTPLEWQLQRDIRELTATLTVTFAMDAVVLDNAVQDAGIGLQLDDVTVFAGLIDSVQFIQGRGSQRVEVSARDRAGRLVDESAALTERVDVDLVSLAQELAAPWFSSISLSNTVNRQVLRGRGSRSSSGAEPLFSRRGDIDLRGMVGQSKGDVLRTFLEPAQLLAWSQADGRALVIASPNQGQAPQYRLDRFLSVRREQSIAERYSDYEGLQSRTGRVLTRRQSVTRDFIHPKQLKMLLQARNQSELNRFLDAEIVRREQTADVLTFDLPGLGQRASGGNTLYAPDTVARIILPGASLFADYYVTGVQLSKRRTEERASLTAVPVGTRIVA